MIEDFIRGFGFTEYSEKLNGRVAMVAFVVCATLDGLNRLGYFK
jgi:hypothetical protein